MNRVFETGGNICSNELCHGLFQRASLAEHVTRFVSPLYHSAYAGRRGPVLCFLSVFIIAKRIRRATVPQTGGRRRAVSDKRRIRKFERGRVGRTIRGVVERSIKRHYLSLQTRYRISIR